jgi:hypothetical protein
MKILYPDCISSVTADSADADYPVANVSDDHPQKFWRAAAGVTTATLSIVTTTASVAGLCIAGTNAVSGVVTVKNSTEVTTYETHNLSSTWGRFFLKLNSAYTEVLHITVALTATAAVYAGILRCGTLIDLADPQYGLKQQRQDYSIKKELSNGGLNIINRNMPRQYDLSFIFLRADYDELDNLFFANGSFPLGMLISDNINLDDQYSGFFHIIDPPSGTYDYLTHTGCSITIKEAV